MKGHNSVETNSRLMILFLFTSPDGASYLYTFLYRNLSFKDIEQTQNACITLNANTLGKLGRGTTV